MPRHWPRAARSKTASRPSADKLAGTPAQLPGARRPGFVAFAYRDFMLFWASRCLGVLAIEMQVTTVGWQVYRITGRELDLGLVGLAQFAPFALLFLVSGILADRLPRVRIMAGCLFVQTLCAAGFLVLTLSDDTRFELIFAVLVVLGIARAFLLPAQQSIIPVLVPAEHLANAIAWSSSGLQMAKILGPTIAGIMIAIGAATGMDEGPGYAIVTGIMVVAFGLALFIRSPGQILSTAPLTIDTLLAGLRFIRSRQVILGAIGLDLFAVLFGGAIALLPVFAKDILGVGAEGFGILRSAFTFGGFVTAITLTQLPVRRHAGVLLLFVVALFGVGVIVFGASENFWLSLAALFVMGAADGISVFIRNNLVQVITPPDLLGRVSAVNGVFLGASNELGEFESGVTAHWWGTVPAVVIGGGVTIAVAVLFAWRMPQLRSVDSLDPRALIERYRDPPDWKDR